METIGSLFLLLLILVMINLITGAPFYSMDHQPSANGLFKFPLLLIVEAPSSLKKRVAEEAATAAAHYT